MNLGDCFLLLLGSLRTKVKFTQHDPRQVQSCNVGETRNQIRIIAEVRNYDVRVQEDLTSRLHRPFRSLPR